MSLWICADISRGLIAMAELTSPIVEVGMEQALQDVFRDLLCWNAVIIPSLDHAVDRVLDDGFCDLTRGLVERERKVVLRQERVCWV